MALRLATPIKSQPTHQSAMAQSTQFYRAERLVGLAFELKDKVCYTIIINVLHVCILLLASSKQFIGL